MNYKERDMTTKVDKTVTDIVKHMALPSADPKLKNQLARYVKGQILALLTQMEVKDQSSLNTMLMNHFDAITEDNT